VLTNLLGNSIKYTDEGGRIALTLRAGDGAAVLSVRDEGIGIAPEHHPHIFERFVRAVSVRHYGGLGLGLYICRRIVEAHGGSIRVESQPGKGATFTLELPCSA